MVERDIAAMLEDLVRSEPVDYAGMLSDLQCEGIAETLGIDGEEEQSFVAESLSLYQETIGAYGPTESIYQSTVEFLTQPATGILTTTTNS